MGVGLLSMHFHLLHPSIPVCRCLCPPACPSFRCRRITRPSDDDDDDDDDDGGGGDPPTATVLKARLEGAQAKKHNRQDRSGPRGW